MFIKMVKHRFLKRFTLSIDKFADDDPALEIKSDRFRIGAVFNVAVVAVKLHLLHSIAELIAAAVERRAWSKNLDK